MTSFYYKENLCQNLRLRGAIDCHAVNELQWLDGQV